MSRTAADRAEHQLSLCLDHIVALVGDGFREEAKSVIVANEARAANRAAEGMRDAAAKAAEREYVDSPSHGYARERLASSYIARTIRALPLPDPTPDPQDATIARLSAELDDAKSKLYVPGRWRCPKCNFGLTQMRLRAEDGAVGVRDDPGEKCPNCDTPLWRVTEREAGDELAERCQEQMQRAIKAEAELEAARDQFKCKARPSLPAGPQDCDWPQCGCDPAANRVLAHLQECGFTIVDEATVGVALTEAREALDSALAELRQFKEETLDEGAAVRPQTYEAMNAIHRVLAKLSKGE